MINKISSAKTIILRAAFGFNPFPNNPWLLHVCRTSLLKTLWEKKKLLKTSNFSFFPQCFSPFFRTFQAIFIKFEIVVCKLFQHQRVKNLSLGKGLNIFSYKLRVCMMLMQIITELSQYHSIFCGNKLAKTGCRKYFATVFFKTLDSKKNC